MAYKFCPSKLTEDEDKRSGAKEPKPGVLIRESLEGTVKRSTHGRKGKSRGSRKK